MEKYDYQKHKEYQLNYSRTAEAANLTLDDIINVPDICPVLGIPILFGEKVNSPNSPSIDRFDSNKGYTKFNIRMISNRANTLKSNGTLEEFEQIIRYLKGLS